MKKSLVRTIACISLNLVAFIASSQAQTTAFVYQGKLSEAGVPASGTYSMQFKLFDALSSGTPVGATINDPNVAVTNGMFTVRLDFDSSPFSGADRYLEISVRKLPADPFTTLSPRQQITSSPYAIQTIKARQADFATTAQFANTATTSQQADLALDSQKLGGVAASQYLTAANAGASFVRNTTTPQTADFNITGNGTVDGTFSAATINGTLINAANQFNIGGNRILSNGGTENLFAGVGAGQVNAGTGNAFFGAGAGQSNTSGESNSFFGRGAGNLNTQGMFNSFFGDRAGLRNTTAAYNTFVGSQSGYYTDSGAYNSFFGARAGEANTVGTSNTFVGYGAGSGSTGSFNSFFGMGTGIYNTGNNNTFLGSQVGFNHGSGSNNTLLGAGANVTASDLTYATAVGAGAVVSANDSIVLGRFLDTARVPGSLNVSGSLTGGFVTAPVNGGTGLSTVGGSGNFLRSNGTNWVSAALVASDLPPGSGFYIQNNPASTQSASFDVSGGARIGSFLGLGTTVQSHKLAIQGGPLWTTTSWNGSVELGNRGAIGWGTNVSGLSFGMGQTDLGFSIFTTASPLGSQASVANNQISISNNGNVGIGTQTPPTAGKLMVVGQASNGVGISINGNAVQSSDKGGWVKAMLTVGGGGTIQSCYNGETGSSVAPCGFIVTYSPPGEYSINLGYPAFGRFPVVTAVAEGRNAGANAIILSGNIFVKTFITDQDLDQSDRSFNLIVF